jgi:quercetin dioxygenase-like cupin family protein
MALREKRELIEDPVFNYRIRFGARKGDLLPMDIYVDPGGGVSIAHYHPSIEERFTVKKGEATFTADGEEITARAGDPAVVVRPGVRHTFRNSGEVEAHIACEAEPALELQGFLTEAAEMAQAGKYTKGGTPKGPGAFLDAAEFLDRYRESVVITGGAVPPPRLQPALLGPLARLRRRRRRSGGRG